MILHWWCNVDAENKMILKWCHRLFICSLCSVVNASFLLCELLFKFARYLFQSFQLILHVLIDSWYNNALTCQLFYHFCQSSHLSSKHQLVVSTFVEFIEYLQLVSFLMYILCLDWILLQDSNTRLSLICWYHIDDTHYLSLMIRMKHKHHINDVLLLKEIVQILILQILINFSNLIIELFNI